jgi:hypothetical protein
MSQNLLQEYLALCPYCGESFTTLIDLSIGSQEYTEDCQICCRPIIFTIENDTISEDASVNLRTEND